MSPYIGCGARHLGEVEPAGALGHPHRRAARGQAPQLVPHLSLHHDGVDEVVEGERLAARASELGHGLVGGDEDGDPAVEEGAGQGLALHQQQELEGRELDIA